MRSIMKMERSGLVLRGERIVGTILFAMLFVFVGARITVNAQSNSVHDETPAPNEAATEAVDSSVAAVRKLTDRDPLVRQRAAEELARRAATEQRRMIEGHRWQEKDGRVKLALDWALYRTGKTESLYSVVRALDSSRSKQAIGYLSELEGPEPLYQIMARTKGNTQIKLLEVLARIGNAETLEQLKPYTTNLDPVIADAAKFAEREITIRLAEEPPPAKPTRQRQITGRDEEASPQR